MNSFYTSFTKASLTLEPGLCKRVNSGCDGKGWAPFRSDSLSAAGAAECIEIIYWTKVKYTLYKL